MYHLDNGSGIDTMPTVANKQSSSVKWFTEGDNKNSPSYPGQDWFNMMQAEMLNILTAAKVTPDKTKLNQVTLAIQQLIKNKTPSASLTAAGVVQLDSSTNSTVENKAATPKAVKAAYDLANTANTTSHKKNQNVIIDKSNPQLNMYNPNKHGVSIKLKDDNEFEILYLNDFGWSVKARYIESSNTFQFLNLNGFTINSKEAIKQGDHGIGGKSIVDAGDGSYPKGCGFIYLPKGAVASPEPSIPLVGLNIISNSDQWGGQLLLRDGATAPRIFVRTIGYGEFKGSAEFITTSNIANYVSSKAEYWYLDGTKQSPRVVSTSTELEFTNIYDEFTLFIPQLRVKGSDGITRWLDINTFFYEYGNIYGINVALSPDDNKVLISCAQHMLIAGIQKRSGLPAGYAPSSNVTSGEFRLKVLKLK